MKVFSFHFLCGEYLSPKIMTTQNVTKGPCLAHHLQIFSPVLWVVFFFFMVSFAVQKLGG